MDNFKRDNIDSFLESLNYWQRLNLYITLIQARKSISYFDAKTEALEKVLDSGKLKFLLEDSINSPGPKSELIQNNNDKEELKIKDQLIATLLKRIDTLEQSSP